MGFGTELQGHPSHTALLQLQDAEIRLLENIKKCVSQRIKCDRDYASALSGMVTTAHKLESSEFNTPLFQAWSTVINETENIIKLIKENADKMCTHTLERLVLVINEKKAARKTYSEEHHRLESEFNKLDDSVNKQQTEISRLVAKVVQDRSKYEEVCLKGKGGSKLEDSRNRYTRSETKLQVTHNDYVRILKEVSIHQQGYVRTTLPDLLNLQETIQKKLVQQSKEILEDCITHMDHSSESYKKCHSSMYRSVECIKVAGVYDDFLNKYKSDPLSLSKYEYKTSLLDNYKGTAVVGEFAINGLTLESLKQRCSDYKNNLTSCQSRKDLKTDELKQLKNELGTLQSSDTKHFIKWNAVEVLEWDIGELECNENKQKVMNEIMTNALQTLSDSPVPAGIEFSDSIPPSGSKEQLEAHESSNLSQKMKSTFGKAKLFKRSQLSPAQDAPEPPLKDFFDPSNAPETSHERESHMVEAAPVENSSHGSLEPGYQPCDFPGGAASKTDSVAVPDLHDEEWFHGLLPREEVQRLLVHNGDFLVRESKNRKTKEIQYVLSVMWNGHKHFIIQGEEGNWRFEAEVFATIGDLIQNQFLSNAPVTKKSEAILKNPICKMDWEIRNDDVVLGTHIDKGNFGEVFRGTYKNMDVAIKTCRETLSEEMKRKFLQEGRILKQYNHPNIVRFIGIAAQKQPVMIVMEFVDGGSLLNFLKKKGASIPKPSLIKMCEDAGKGMSYLESKNCIHRDLAARNCLVDEKQNVTKISDFGMSREEEEYTVSGGLKQIPIKWTAPEALNYGTYTSASDIWSFGILMWEVFAFGKIPYPGLTNTQARERIEEGYRMPAPEGCPKSVYNLMVMCWEHEPKERPLFATLYKSLHKVRIEAEQ